jgi:Bifunctional DNA primase/polymerase, N-terminal
MAQTILEVRKALIDRGYVPIPVIGKVPPFARWQKIENVSREMLEAWGRNWPRASNTGILTKHTPTLDADIVNEPAAIAIEELVRERFEERGYILPRIGKAPKRAVPFRTPDPFAKIAVSLIAADGSTGEKIEFMCNGQQVVVAGIHPGTGKPYSWPLGNPTHIAHDDLPDISEVEAQQLVDDIAELLCRDFGYTRAAGRPRKGNGTPEDHAGDWQSLIDGILAGADLHAGTRNLAANPDHASRRAFSHF